MRYRVEEEKIKFISTSEYVIFCLLYKHHWNTKSACFQRRGLLCNHNYGDLFLYEHNILSSRVKIWSFRRKAHLAFHWCLYNKNNSSLLENTPEEKIFIISTQFHQKNAHFTDHFQKSPFYQQLDPHLIPQSNHNNSHFSSLILSTLDQHHHLINIQLIIKSGTFNFAISSVINIHLNCS